MSRVGECIKKKDISGATALIEDKQFSVRGRRALSIYATGFSDNYLGERSRDMLKCVDTIFVQLQSVKEDDSHYAKAVEAMREYYRLARLPMEEVDALKGY